MLLFELELAPGFPDMLSVDLKVVVAGGLHSRFLLSNRRSLAGRKNKQHFGLIISSGLIVFRERTVMAGNVRQNVRV
jgi:hypothetical protein